MKLRGVAILVCLSATIAGCQHSMNADGLPQGAAAYAKFPGPDSTRQAAAYDIGPLDVLKVTVFQEPDLSFDELQVDASGNISYPLLGSVHAQGKTALELSNEIATQLGRKYLVDPQVSVTVVSSISQRVTVEGDVNKPGVYEINGTSTLLEALAQAESPTEVAKLNQIVIFRQVDGKRMGGVFNLNDIREGKAEDPQIKGGDVIVVGYSAMKGAFRDLFKTAPFFNVFRFF